MNVLITGASRGIGLEMVKYGIEHNWRIFACCRHPQQADSLFSLAKLANGRVSVHVADMYELATIQALSYELRNDAIDILINNAGIYGSDNNKFGHVDVQSWINTFQVNSIAPLKVAEALLEQVRMGEKKIIACISSKMGSMGDNGSGGSYIYRSSKAALNAVVKSMSVDLEQDGINCVALHPGWVQTEMGGPNAEITTRECVTSLFNIMLSLEAKDTGRFIDIDGTTIPW